MAIADYKDGNVQITWTVTQEWSLDESFAKVAKILGVTQGTLAKILDGDECLDDHLDEDVQSRLIGAGEMQSEELEEFEAVES